MSELKIECPACGHSFELTEALAGPLLEGERRRAIMETERRFALDTKAIAEEAARKARAESEAAIVELTLQKEATEAQLAKAREAEIAALKAKVEADEMKRGVEVEI